MYPYILLLGLLLHAPNETNPFPLVRHRSAQRLPFKENRIAFSVCIAFTFFKKLPRTNITLKGIGVHVSTKMVQTANVTAVRVAMDFVPQSAYALYDKGVLQMMSNPKPYYTAPSGNPLARFYALGGAGNQLSRTSA